MHYIFYHDAQGWEGNKENLLRNFRSEVNSPFFIFISLNFSYNRFYFTINFIYIWLVKGSHKVLDQSQYEVKQNLLKLFNTDYKIALHAC